MDRKEVWITTFAVVNQSLLKQSEHPGNSQNAITAWGLSNHGQCYSLSISCNIRIRNWTLCGQPSFLNPLKVTDCTERGRHGCMVNGRCQPQILLRSNSSERTPPSVMHTLSHTLAYWLLKEYILWRENCFSGKIEIKKNFQICQTNVVA